MKVSGEQARDGYIRAVAVIYTTLAGVITTLATVTLLAAMADHVFGLGWGLDYNHAWILLIVIATCAVLFVFGRAIFRIAGAYR